MNWLRYAGRIILALGTILIGLWATLERLLPVPPYQFWLGLLCYLLVAEVVWTLVDLRAPRAEAGLARQGLRRLTRQERRVGGYRKGLYDGGRVRVADVLADTDLTRDVLQVLLAEMLTRESGPRLHVLVGEPGSGRSTLLLRLGQALAQQRQTVFVALPTVDLPGLPLVLEAARKGQVYLLLDDLDLRPQAEEWLYEVMSAGRPIVVLATVQQPSEAATDQDGLAAVRPAGFLAQATIHRPQVTAADLVALARKLSVLGLQAGAERPADGQTDLIAAVRCLRGADPLRHLWQDLEAGAALPEPHQAMVALCGVAELGLPENLWVPVLGEKAMARWERAGLLAQEDGLALPPHRSVCLDFLRHRENCETVVTEALQAFAALTANVSPEFMPRLLFGLSRCEELVTVVRAWVSGLQPLPPQADWPAALQRLWRHVFDALDIPYEATATGGDTPPELSLLANLAFDRADYAAALELSRRLSHNAIYQAAARFNTALALAHVGQLTAAEAELADVSGAPLGTHYLRGLVAEASGDYVKALDAFEDSRKAGELQLAATRRLAHCFIRSGAPRSAIPLLESALSYEPLRPDLYGGLAVAHLHAGMVQRAAAQSARAIQAGVEPSAARKAVARACAEVHAYDRAATELEACVAFDPTDLEAWRDLAAACRWLGRFTREEECLQRVQLADPDDPATVYQMALCQRDQGRPEQTARLLEPLLTTLAEANHPLAIPALLLAAEVAGTGGEADRQRALALRAVELGDTTGWAQYWLADSYGDPTPEAHTAYRRAVTVFLEALEEGIPPRRAAKLWQAVYLAAVKLKEDALATKAERRTRQEVSVCEVLGAEIESVFHRRTVPTEVFNESLPSAGADEGQGSSRDETRSAPVVEAPIIRTRLGGRASGRS